MAKKTKLPVFKTDGTNEDWMHKLPGYADEVRLHDELAKKFASRKIIPVKHLPGQHDQSSHGSWASKRIDREFARLFPLTEVEKGKMAPTPYEQKVLGLTIDQGREASDAEVTEAKRQMIEARKMVKKMGIRIPTIHRLVVYHNEGFGGVAASKREQVDEFSRNYVPEFESVIFINGAELHSEKTYEAYKEAAQQKKDGEWPLHQVDSPTAVLVHEIGHVLSHSWVETDTWDSFVINHLFEGEAVSEYGLINPMEHFAEWVTAIVTGWQGVDDMEESRAFGLVSMMLESEPQEWQ